MIFTGGHRPRGLEYSPSVVSKPAKANSTPSSEATPSATPTQDSFTPQSITAPLQTRALSKERKKAIKEAHLDAYREATQKHAVVVGGGPGGLAAAITLAQMGMKVTVLEARANETGERPAHARPHQISLRQDSLETLKTLGAYEDVMSTSGFVQKEVTLRGDRSNPTVEKKVPQGQAQVHDGQTFLRPTLLNTDSVSQVRISDVEKALLKQAGEAGVEVKAGVMAQLAKSSDGNSYDVSVRKVDRETYQPTGEAVSLGTPDLVVVADGAGSPLRNSLGIEMVEESAPKHYLGGHVQTGIGAQTRKAAITEENGQTRHVMATGHAQYDQTWVSVEITPEEAQLPPEKRAELLADKAQWVMQDQVGVGDIGWGAGQLTTVQNRRAKTTTAGDNVVLLGDAAGTGSVWVGGGLNLALTTHLSALRSLASRMETGSDRATSLHIYDKSVQWATSVWHKAGAQELAT